MDEQQLQQLVQEVAGALQQGANPEEVMQALVQQGLPEDVAMQVIEAAMQMVGGEGGQPQEGGEQGGSVLAAVADQDPELLVAILQEWESLPPVGKEEIMAQLQGAMEQGGAPQGEEPPMEEQGTGMFG